MNNLSGIHVSGAGSYVPTECIRRIILLCSCIVVTEPFCYHTVHVSMAIALFDGIFDVFNLYKEVLFS